MRLRIAALASALAALIALPVSVVNAAPKHPHGVTINATPNPVSAGDGVFIYGQLNGSNSGGQTIRLYARFNPARGFRPIASTKTNPQGFYQFSRAQGTIYTNRDWFVRGPAGARSRTVRERVNALIGLNASTTTTDTGHPVLFSGHVTPNHTGERVYLQEDRGKSGTSDDYRTVKSAVIGPGSNYSIAYRFSIPGEHVMRVLFRGDARNIRSASASVPVVVQQAQVPGFTINTSSPIITYGSSATISGVLSKTGMSGSTSVSLWARSADQRHFVLVATTNTGSGGSYSFNVAPAKNTVYQARLTFKPKRHSAVLFEGVRDVVTLSSSSTTSQVGGHVTFTGVVTPDKAGHRIYLQLLGGDGDWHNVAVGTVRFDSTYRFGWTFGEAGTRHFRVWISHDEFNVGAASPPVTVTVSGAVPTGTVPPAM